MSTVIFLLGLFQVVSLPNIDPFLEVTRSKLVEQFDQRHLLEDYTYRCRTIRNGEVKEYDVFQVESGLYRQLISENGVPLPSNSSEKHLEKLDQPAFLADSNENRDDIVEDMFRIWLFTVIGRAQVGDRPTIVIKYEPREVAKPQTKVGRWLLQKIEGVAWIDEEDHRVVRLSAEVVDDVTLGWGLLGKIQAGTEFVREWRKLDGETWAPYLSLSRVRGRTLMLSTNFEEIQQYFDFRKLNSETKADQSSPR